MANTIILKNSSVASKVPLASDLELGEVAINTTDGKLFTKKGDGSVVEVGASTGAGVSNALYSPDTELLFTTSRTWVAPFTGTVKVTAIGAGGSGALYYYENSTTQIIVAGGGAGGCARGEYSITQGDSYTITIGLGGAPLISTAIGLAGGTTSITGTGIGLVANGGGGGTKSTLPANGVLGGAGGTASGGQYNFTGGNGGDILPSANTFTRTFATGGGAVGLRENGFNGGSIGNTTSNDLIYGSGATGGGGVGGKGGDFTRNNAFTNLSSGGGSAYGSYPANADRYAITYNVPHYRCGPEQNGASIFDVTGHGGQAITTITYNHLVFGPEDYAGGPGGGGGGNTNVPLTIDLPNVGTEFMQGGDGGIFGGGGATSSTSSNLAAVTRVDGGSGGMGGGGGGCISRDTGIKASSGAGGLGLVAIQYTSIS